MYNCAIIGEVDWISDMLCEALPFHPKCAHLDVEGLSLYLGTLNGPLPVSWSYIAERFSDYDIIFVPEGYMYYPEAAAPRVEIIEKYNKWKNVVTYGAAIDQQILWTYALDRCLVYFKRACTVDGRRPMLELAEGKIFPIDYGILGAYKMIPHDLYDRGGGRDIDIGYAQQFTYDSSCARGALGKMLRHADEFIPLSDFHHRHVQMFYTTGRRYDGRSLHRRGPSTLLEEPSWWVVYNHLLRRCKVILESGVEGTPGNLRTWEAHASGALIIRENQETIPIHPFIDGQHLIYYKTVSECGHSLANFDPPRMREEAQHAIEKAFYYSDVSHEEERRAIAEAGYAHAMKHHTSAARVDYMMDVIEQKLKERS